MRTVTREFKSSFVLKNKLDDQGSKYIYLRYYICNGEYVYRTTSKRIRPEDWDKKNQRMIVPDRPLWKFYLTQNVPARLISLITPVRL